MTGAVGASSGQVSGYLGRVLDGDGDPVGTCFQVAPGVLVTARHVLEDIGAAAKNAPVRVDPLGGGEPFDATAARLDAAHDLAVLVSGSHLPDTAGALAATDQMRLRAGVTVTGHCVIADPGRTARWLTTVGHWMGPAMWEDATPTGRMTAEALLPGMSGAPVIRDSDGAVAGVVAGRYNSADGWLAGTVWVTRTEDLAVLLGGLAEVTMRQVLLAGPLDLLLTVTDRRVRLTGVGVDVAADHDGVRYGLVEAVNEGRRARARASLLERSVAEIEQTGQAVLGRASELLGSSFLPGPVAAELGKVLAAAERAHQPVRLGLDIPPELAGLPWEALPGPGTGQPLALHDLVSIYRKADTVTSHALPGPLRIVVAIASPEAAGGQLLDYERELRNVLAAVRSARQDAADVRVVPFATTMAIRDELNRGLAHVLHISGHGSPGRLILENQDGSGRPVTAEELVREAIPAGRMPPVITLAACYSDAAGRQDGTSFAARLCQHGAAAVIATETSITDIYATRLLARVYGTLARPGDADVVAALSAARRDVQDELETSPDPRDSQLAALGEWAAVTVLAADGSVPVLDPNQDALAVPQPSRPQIAGLAGREDWYFVGRRAEQRRWPADLISSPLAGIVIYGIGGTGKTTLAAEVVIRCLDQEPGRVLVSLTGPLTLESLLGAVITEVRRMLLIQGHGGQMIQALDVAGRPDVAWQDRLAILREHVLGKVPILLLLDNFEDNLRPGGDVSYTVGDEVLAGLLAAWTADPGRCRFLVTCRYRFTLPGGAEQTLSFRQLGALSRAETMKLAWSLPTLDTLDEAQLERVWRLVGGHPRSLEYLDALLSGGTARYPDVTRRLHEAIDRRLSGSDRDQWLAARTGLDATLAETVTLAADDVLLDDLLPFLGQVPGAAELLLGVLVYREPVDVNAVLFAVGQSDEDAGYVPDRRAASQQIQAILAAAGITVDETFDLAAVSADVQAQLTPHLAELNRSPTPALRPDPRLAEQVAACQAASLLTVSGEGEDRRFFVHRWTATELSERAVAGRGLQLARAHRQAANYWLWRIQVWPQDRTADVHDMLETRHHLLQAGDVEAAGKVTEGICLQLQTWGAWDQVAALIHDTLARLPADYPRRAAYYGQLGVLAQRRGDYEEAVRQYQRALDIFERLGNQASMASSYHNLGVLAQDRGDYEEAARQYQRALNIREQLGDQVGMASSYHQLGVLAQARRGYEEAARQYQRALNIDERLGDQAGMASSYHQLGRLAQDRGDYDEAIRQYERALDINERLGNQAGMANNHHQLGVLAQDRGDYEEAARQYQRALNTSERLGDQASMASSYHQLGRLAQLRGDYEEAVRQYQRALDIFERLGNQASMATSYHNLGVLAQDRGDYEEAARQYQRALNIRERLGDQAGMATTYSQFGILEQDRGGPAAAAITWHVRALAIRLRLDVPQAANNLRRLAAYRRELSVGPFTSLLTQAAADDADLVEAITSLLDQIDSAETSTP